MRALLVDDEPLARRELRRLLAPHPWVEIVGEAANVAEAQKAVEALRPDLLFLDIQMPGGTGFDLLERLEEAPLVIFTTAFDRHAVRAFEVDALDYLLKPVEPERLAAALARLRSRGGVAGGARSGSGSATEGASSPLERLFVRDGERCWFVTMREVRLLTAEGNYVQLEWDTNRVLLGRSLGSLERRLDPARFFRANRQQIVNLDFVGGVELGVGGRLELRLRGGPDVEVSRRQARVFRARMGT
jgi:two-component system LytT family response regulator